MGMRSLRARDADAREHMDGPGADPVMLEKTYERFRLVNAVVSGERAVYRRWVRPRLSPVWGTRLLDIGSGSADLPRRLLRWADDDGLRLEITAIDPDARAMRWASAQPPTPGLTLRRAVSGELVDAGEHFDLVLSNHVLHHLDGHELGALLRDSELLLGPGGLAVHGDIERTRLGYAGFWLGTLPFAGNLLAGSYIRPDGLTSIRRSHTAAELARVLPEGWAVRRAFPSRLELVWGADA
ncbi:methyltransferase domain-containing protein [Agromyces badenianii]|nr:methyltransferase [Agromyces badenianii]